LKYYIMHSTFIYQPFYTISFVYMEYQIHFLYIVNACLWMVMNGWFVFEDTDR